MESLASPSDTNTKDLTTSSTSFLKRRHDDAFLEDDDQEEEEVSPSKKPRLVAPEILPRIHHLHSPPQVSRRREKPVSDRNHRRKSAMRKALVESQQQIGLLQQPTLNQLGNNKKNQLLKLAQTSPQHVNHSEDLASLPVAQTPVPSVFPDTEDSQIAKDNIYAILEDGKYRFNIEEVAYELLDEVAEEESTHQKWLEEVDRSVCADIEEYVQLNPRYRSLNAEQQHHKMLEFSRGRDVVYDSNWHKTCQDIPFDPPNDETMDSQLAMSIAMAAHLNPLPTNAAENEIDRFVERVQRKGIEHHRAHHRGYLYKWKEIVRMLKQAGEDQAGPPLEQQHEQPIDVAIDPLLVSTGNRPVEGALSEFNWPFFS